MLLKQIWNTQTTCKPLDERACATFWSLLVLRMDSTSELSSMQWRGLVGVVSGLTWQRSHWPRPITPFGPVLMPGLASMLYHRHRVTHPWFRYPIFTSSQSILLYCISSHDYHVSPTSILVNILSPNSPFPYSLEFSFYKHLKVNSHCIS